MESSRKAEALRPGRERLKLMVVLSLRESDFLKKPERI
jgi:hypothetical protein